MKNSGQLRPSQHRFALTFAIDQQDLGLTLFAAERIARLTPDRRFDILICSTEDILLPAQFAALGIQSVHLDVADEMASQDFPLDGLPIATYLRLWLPRMLGGRYERILYMDSDTYLAQDARQYLNALFEIDMHDRPVAATRDMAHWNNLDGKVNEFADIDGPAPKYMNSGVMLIDPNRYEDSDLLNRILHLNQRHRIQPWNDQTLINLALRGEWTEFSPLWNWMWGNRFPQYTRTVKPIVLHFCGWAKPWAAHRVVTNYPRHLITAYQTHFATWDTERAFDLPTSGPLRAPVSQRLRRYLRQIRNPNGPAHMVDRFANVTETLV